MYVPVIKVIPETNKNAKINKRYMTGKCSKG